MTIIFLIVGSLFVYIGWKVQRMDKIAALNWKKVVGTVVGFCGNDKGKQSLFPLIKFSHNQKRYLVKSNTGSSTPLYTLNQQIEIFVNGDSPPRVSIPSGLSKVFAFILIAMGSVAIAVYVFTFKFDYSIFISLAILGYIFYKIKTKKDELQKHREFKNFDFAKGFYSEAVEEDLGRDKFAVIAPELVQMRASRQNYSLKWVAIVFLILGSTGLHFSYKWHTQRESFLKTAESVVGKVSRLEDSSDSDSTVYYPIIKYRHPASQMWIEFRHNIGSSHPSYDVGDEVSVLYAPDNPQQAMIDWGKWNKTLPLLCVALSVLALIYGLKWLFFKKTRLRGAL